MTRVACVPAPRAPRSRRSSPAPGTRSRASPPGVARETAPRRILARLPIPLGGARGGNVVDVMGPLRRTERRFRRRAGRHRIALVAPSSAGGTAPWLGDAPPRTITVRVAAELAERGRSGAGVSTCGSEPRRSIWRADAHLAPGGPVSLAFEGVYRQSLGRSGDLARIPTHFEDELLRTLRVAVRRSYR